mmetsp:Transcript_20164/g.54052  ORF Transcript_20164/g.54052 Transcript_20164/m.54052 type:complete len:223 (-) Transcript_20164:108-776(-)
MEHLLEVPELPDKLDAGNQEAEAGDDRHGEEGHLQPVHEEVVTPVRLAAALEVAHVGHGGKDPHDDVQDDQGQLEDQQKAHARALLPRATTPWRRCRAWARAARGPLGDALHDRVEGGVHSVQRLRHVIDQQKEDRQKNDQRACVHQVVEAGTILEAERIAGWKPEAAQGPDQAEEEQADQKHDVCRGEGQPASASGRGPHGDRERAQRGQSDVDPSELQVH